MSFTELLMKEEMNINTRQELGGAITLLIIMKLFVALSYGSDLKNMSSANTEFNNERYFKLQVLTKCWRRSLLVVEEQNKGVQNF